MRATIDPAVLEMTPPSLAEDLARAIAAARAAALAIRRVGVTGVREKGSPKDIVTAADHAAEAAAIAALALRSDERLIAEESSPLALTEARSWLIDPLDGTMNFAHGLPFYGPAVALTEGGVPLVAATIDVERDELFIASAGGGTWLLRGGERAQRLSLGDRGPEGATCYVGLWGPGDESITKTILAAGASVRSGGASAIGLAWTAAGRFDAYIQRGHLWPWDVMGGILLCREAGLQVSTDRLGSADGAATITAAPASIAPLLGRALEGLPER
jgi:myo-inositol-1(or 4)-monophosphatase